MQWWIKHLLFQPGIRAIRKFKKGEFRKACYKILEIPIYLVVLFGVILIADVTYVNNNELDKQKQYISKNIEFTKKAYDIDIDEIDLQSTGTITADDIKENSEVIENINIFNKARVISHLEEYQTNLGYYTYNSAGIGLYDIDGKSNLVYVSPREIKSNETRTYSNKTYEYTHGYGAIITSASTTNENRNIKVYTKFI